MRKRSGARLLAAVLFTDIVDSTAHARRIGDRRWKELIGRHHAIVRRELKRYGGRELDTAGDGFFASFNEPAAAIRCACATAEAVRKLGIEIRTGVHFGECEQVGSKLGGLTVVVGARVMSLGGAGDVLTTGSTRELIGGADLGFEERGRHALKGVDGEWQVFAVTEVDGAPRPGPIDADEAAQRLAAIQPTGALRRAPSAAQTTSRRWVVAVGIALVLALVAISVPLAAIRRWRRGRRDELDRAHQRARTEASSSPPSSASGPARARSGSGASGSPSRTAASWRVWTSRMARSSRRSGSAPRRRGWRSARARCG